MGCALLLCLLLAFLKSTIIVKDKFNAFLLGIDLQGCVERLAALGSHTFHFHSFAFHKVFILSVRKGNTLDFLRDVHTVGTQGYDFIRLRIDRYVGRERFAILGCYLNGLAEITRSEELLLFFGRELVAHIGKVKLWFFSQRMNCQTDIAIIVRTERKAGFGIDGGVADRYGNCDEIALLPIEHLFQFSTLLQSLTGKTEIVEHLPIHLFGVDSGGILLLGQIILKGYSYLCQLLFTFWLLSAL